jgi:uncharacterized membrane-anchored protein YitT (DUF2179 family)
MKGRLARLTSSPVWRVVRDYSGITVGLVLTALALDVFLVPNRLAAGGVSGLATVLHYTVGFPVGLVMVVLNVVILLAGILTHGLSYGVKTLYGAFGLSVLVDILAPFVPKVTGDPMLATLYGGILSGIGIGIVFRFGGSTGGTDIVAQILARYSNIAVGKLFLIADGFVMLAAAVAFGIKLALYGMISVFVMGWVIDLVQEGVSTEKVVYIMTDKHEEIAARVFSELDRGVTFFKSIGAYTGNERNTVFVVIARKQVDALVKIVRELDPQAFVIIHDAAEVLGHGFKPLRGH